MPSFETALPRVETRPGKIKQIIEKIFSPRAEKTRLITLNRERVEELISQFPEDEVLLRQDLLKRFEKMNGKKIPGNLSWFEIRDLFEAVFKVNTGPSGDKRAYQILSEGLGYSIELLTEVMHCVGRSQQFETKGGTGS